MRIKMPGLGQERGDTIVEVLIAIAVIGTVLGGAYVTSNRSLAATRAAQERGNALKVAESQMEQIKSLAKTAPATLFAVSGAFCVASVNPVSLPVATNAACKVDGNGTPTTVDPQYSISITRVPFATGQTFTLTNQWTDAGGDITDNLRMIYRVYD